jgi:capsule polysaccharide modification protein KpsS
MHSRDMAMVKALCYNLEGRGFDTLWGNWIAFNLPNPFGRSRPWVYSACNRNEYQKKRNNVSADRARPVRRADNLTVICEPTV